jgi:DNA-binding NtrC family response regulator
MMTAGGSDVRVLVVEDEPLIRWSIAEVLGAAGLTVHQACDAAAARRLLFDGADPVDVVLMDLHLPDCADLTLFDEVRRRLPERPVVVMTAHATPELRTHMLARGARAVMAKPFDLETLEPVLRGAQTRVR